jgi:hypothetical protein
VKKLLFAGFIVLLSCKNKSIGIFQTKQQKAEETVKEYLHEGVDLSRRMKFTKLSNDQTVGLIDGFQISHQTFAIKKTLWFHLDTACDKVIGLYTD